ncbi:SRSF protein kinase 2 [Balamuthia mandrillaris]
MEGKSRKRELDDTRTTEAPQHGEANNGPEKHKDNTGEGEEGPTKKVRRDDDDEVGNNSQQQPPQKKPQRQQVSVLEGDVGIRIFLNNETQGWSGVFKHRYTDFIVREVASDGTIVRLTDTSSLPPEEAEEETTETQSEAASSTDAPQPQQPTSNALPGSEAEREEARTHFANLLGKEESERLFEWLHQHYWNERFALLSQREKKALPCFRLAADDDKDHRTAVHQLFKRFFGSVLMTQSESCSSSSSENSQRIVVKFTGGNSGSQQRRQKRREWPADRGTYLRFVLYKENKDTTFALNLLGKMLGVRGGKIFSFSGTKDKRGVTTQHITGFKLDVRKLSGLNARLRGLRVGNYSYVTKPLRLGDLAGNHFEIVLRNVTAPDEQINNSLQHLQKHGFINYFGLQRFGTSSVPTHRVGVVLIKGNWKEAASLVLQPRAGELESVENARKYYAETGDINGTLKQLPKHLVVERLLLEALRRQGPTQFCNAFATLPRNMRTMYGHSYQSYIWNLMASERIQRYGALHPILGDLVFVSTPTEENEKAKVQEEEEEEQELNEEAEGEDSVAMDSNNKRSVKVLETEEELKHYTIDDVVLPLPGHNVLFPQNEIGKAYHEAMALDSISVETFRDQPVRDYRLPGGYRKLIERPHDLKWEIVHYADPDENLLLTDLDLLTGVSLPASSGEKKFKGVRASFMLPSSTYATMCFREMMRQQTHLALQKELGC